MSKAETLSKRLDAVEVRIKPTTGAIFFVTVRPGPNGPERVPVAGWAIDGGPEVMRRPGEDDDALTARATEAAKESNTGKRVPFLWPIEAAPTTER